eukprot:3636206-Amphidinium_carterae.1
MDKSSTSTAYQGEERIPPPPCMPPSSKSQKQAPEIDEHKRETRLQEVGNDGEHYEDDITQWAREFKAPEPPSVQAHVLIFQEAETPVHHKEFQGAAGVKKGQQCYLCIQTFFSPDLRGTIVAQDQYNQLARTLLDTSSLR